MRKVKNHPRGSGYSKQAGARQEPSVPANEIEKEIVARMEDPSIGPPTPRRPLTQADRLRHVVNQAFGGKVSAFARALDVQTTQVSSWLAGRNNPGSAHLRNISALTGFSVDWLLGFNSPEKRDAREKIGDFTKHLRAVLSESTPELFWPGGPDWSIDLQLIELSRAKSVLSEVLGRDPTDNELAQMLNDGTSVTRYEPGGAAGLARAVAEAYWLVRRQRNGEKWGPRFHALARMMRTDAAQFDRDKYWYVIAGLEDEARKASGYGYLLESKTVDWQDILDLDSRPIEYWHPSIGKRYPVVQSDGSSSINIFAERSFPRMWTSFGVAGGVRSIGFATVIDGLPCVWWVNYATGEARYDSGHDLATLDEPPGIWGAPKKGSHWDRDLSFDALKRPAQRVA